MSFPANPLSKFRSHSYYHVLVVCDSTETADALAQQTDPDKWKHPTAPQANLDDPRNDTFDLLGPYAVKQIPLTQGVGKYCVLINGATDASLSIVNARWESVTAAQATVMDQTTSIAVEGELEISEPKGVAFLDTLVKCCIAMGIDAANAIFALKTFFIGYPDWKSDVPSDSNADSTPSPDSFVINDVDPIRFVAYDVQGSFAETGGYYKLSFVALSYGVSRMPQFSKSASGFSFKCGSLQETFAKLASVVENNYENLYACVRETVEQTSPEYADLLTKVKYTFILDEPFLSTEYQVDNSSPQNKDLGTCSGSNLITFPANMSIEDAIHLIMRQCSKVQRDMTDGVDENGRRIRYEYKVHTTYKSTHGENGKLNHEVIYYVKRFMRPKDLQLFDLAAKDDGGGSEELRKNTIEFDYLYTGKNIDILEFDIKLNLGMQYLQIASINNTLKDQLEPTPISIKHVPNYEKEQMGRLGSLNQIPVLFGTQVRTPSYRNKQNVAVSAEAGYTMSKHSSVEVQDATMRIIGNPRLLSSVNRATGPDNLGRPEEVGDNPDGSFYSWGSMPAFTKVNIRMPQNNDDILLFKQNTDSAGAGGELGFTKEFWFTGYYYVVGIKHEFSAGEFTQTLDMLGIPQTSATQMVNRETGSPQQDPVVSCYDNKFASVKAQASSEKQEKKILPHKPPLVSSDAIVAPTTTLKDSVSVYSGKINPDSVQGWQKADPRVKRAVTQAAEIEGVPLGDMVAMAAAESNFKTSAVNPKTQNATGLYQFTTQTWFGTKPGYGIINQFGKELGLAGKSRAEQDAARTDPYINARAAAMMVKQSKGIISKSVGGGYEPNSYDTYLSLFAGPSIASKVIKYDISGQSNKPMSEVYAETRGTSYESVLRDNPQLANYRTVGEFRNYVKKTMDARLTGVKIAQPTTVAAPKTAVAPQAQLEKITPTQQSETITAGEKATAHKSPADQKAASEATKLTTCDQLKQMTSP